jgi:hypothetical protein
MCGPDLPRTPVMGGTLVDGCLSTAVRVARRHVAGFRRSQDLLVAFMLREALTGNPPTAMPVL